MVPQAAHGTLKRYNGTATGLLSAGGQICLPPEAHVFTVKSAQKIFVV